METLPLGFEETLVVPPVDGVEADTELLHSKTLTLDEASAMGTVGGSESEPREPKLEDLKDPDKPEDEPAVATKGADPPPPPPEPRPPILDEIAAVTPEEQRGPNTKGRGRGRGRGGRKGKGKGKGKKQNVEEQEDEVGDQNTPPETTQRSKPKRKKSTHCPSETSTTASSTKMTPKDSKGGQKRKRGKTADPKVVEVKNVGDTAEGPKPKRTRVNQPKKIAAKPKDPKGKKPDHQKELGQEELDFRKKQISRKSSAYHTAKRLAAKEGKSNEEALRLARLAPRLIHHIVEMMVR